jgi:hypothetical protein
MVHIAARILATALRFGLPVSNKLTPSKEPFQFWLCSRNLRCTIWRISLEQYRIIDRELLNRWRDVFRLHPVHHTHLTVTGEISNYLYIFWAACFLGPTLSWWLSQKLQTEPSYWTTSHIYRRLTLFHQCHLYQCHLFHQCHLPHQCHRVAVARLAQPLVGLSNHQLAQSSAAYLEE